MRRAAPRIFRQLTLLPAAQTAHALEAQGSIRSFLVHSAYPGGQDVGEALFMARIRLTGDLTDNIKAEFAYEAAPTYRDSTPPVPAAPQGLTRRIDDIDQVLYPADPGPGEDFLIYQNLDRAFITWSTTGFDLYAGRQPIAFGSARAINPTDVIAPYFYTTIAKEERVGVDAIRLRVPTGDFSELDAGLIGSMDGSGDAIYLRYRGYALETDITVILMKHGENIMAGIDMARSIGGAGVWIEAEHTSPAGGAAYTDADDYTRLTMGTDFAPTDTIYIYAEYHYNGPGTDHESSYPTIALKAAYMEGGVYLLGKHYLAPGIGWDMGPLMRLDAGALISLTDGSALISPAFTISLADETTASLGAYAGTGVGPDSFGLPRTEFGSYPDTCYVSLKHYF